MQRRMLVLVSVVLVLAIAVIAAQRRSGPSSLPDLQRAAKAKDSAPPLTVLIEFGLKDTKPTDWSGKAIVKGATVVRRAGYRFRSDQKNDDKLIAPSAWQAKSHFSVRAPKRNPIVRRLEPIATSGVILYMNDVKKNAAVTVQVNDEKLQPAKVDLNKVLAGEPVKIFGGYAVVRRISSAQPVVINGNENDHPAAAYGPDGTLWVAYISYHLRDDRRRIESPAYKKPPKDFAHLNHPKYAEQLMLRSYHDGKWGEPIAVTDDQQDLARCAVAVTNDNVVWAIYSAHRGDSFDICARSVKIANNIAAAPSPEIRISKNPGPDLSPVACVDSNGYVWAAWQAWYPDQPARIEYSKRLNNWDAPKQLRMGFIGAQPGNCWQPAIAAGPDGMVAIACDVYYRGAYDIFATIFHATKGRRQFITHSSNFQARPSLTFDTTGKLWVAYEHGPPRWGKDYGAQDSKDGNPLYNTRTVRVRCVDGKNILEPAAALPKLDISAPQLPFSAIKTNQFEKRTRQAYPKIGIDGNGHIWLTYRKNFGSRYTSHPGTTWRTYARRLDGDAWTPEMELHHSDGLLDSRPVLLPHHSGGLTVVHNTDGRYTTPNLINNRIYCSLVDLQEKAQAPKLVAAKIKNTRIDLKNVSNEAKAVKRIRDYRINHAGKKLRLLRGEYHRHTEISWDGAPDGSLEDMFRYAIDAAAFDWIGNGDHDNGAGREYPWWLTQKFSDAYYLPGSFTPMFTYERSVSYPHGHRNVMFAQRGIMTLPRLAAGPDQKKIAGISPNDTKMLYRYLHQFDGICAVHTSATGMGTDWRDNDPKVEPIVEIYQGDRMSYEHQGAPRAGYDPKKQNEQPANVGGWRPLGFVDLALNDKGYKLAFQASSDHWSTHISYFIVLAPKNDRRSILNAVKKRHCYGATDNIIVNLKSGEHIQGDEFTTDKAPSLQFEVIGTANIARIDVMKNSRAVHTFRPKAQQYKGDWTDPNPAAGSNYYYIRVVQTDGEVAWGSPMWIRKS